MSQGTCVYAIDNSRSQNVKMFRVEPYYGMGRRKKTCVELELSCYR